MDRAGLLNGAHWRVLAVTAGLLAVLMLGTAPIAAHGPGLVTAHGVAAPALAPLGDSTVPNTTAGQAANAAPASDPVAPGTGDNNLLLFIALAGVGLLVVLEGSALALSARLGT
ncbi:MAG TPA: hypothetical protein VM536_05495 [Chloroflexia bacterium]|nr:hypothetical protein [Chloroflexia bacterium]